MEHSQADSLFVYIPQTPCPSHVEFMPVFTSDVFFIMYSVTRILACFKMKKANDKSGVKNHKLTLTNHNLVQYFPS